jgi:hypothetical protein
MKRNVRSSRKSKSLLTRFGKHLSSRATNLAVALLAAFFFTGCATTTRQAEAGKLYHIGLVWLKEPGNAEHRRKIIEAAHAFAREIPEVQFLTVGQTLPAASSFVDASFDVGFVMRLENKAALDRYSKHPIHEKAAKDVFLPLSQKFLFYDFISE